MLWVKFFICSLCQSIQKQNWIFVMLFCFIAVWSDAHPRGSLYGAWKHCPCADTTRSVTQHHQRCEFDALLCVIILFFLGVCFCSGLMFLCVLQRGETALHMAARAGQADVVRYLLKNGAKVDTKSKVRAVTGSRRKETWGQYTSLKSPFFLSPSAGWSDGVAHLQSAGESRHRPAAAAVWRLCQCCHHFRLHPTTSGSPRRTSRCCCHAAGEWCLTFICDESESWKISHFRKQMHLLMQALLQRMLFQSPTPPLVGVSCCFLRSVSLFLTCVTCFFNK